MEERKLARQVGRVMGFDFNSKRAARVDIDGNFTLVLIGGMGVERVGRVARLTGPFGKCNKSGKLRKNQSLSNDYIGGRGR